MVIATPFNSPIKIGLDRKSANTPNLNRLAIKHQNPVIAVMVITSCQCLTLSPAASGVTTAAITAQVAASGPTISCLEVPNKAYIIIGKTQEYKPTAALTPVSWA